MRRFCLCGTIEPGVGSSFLPAPNSTSCSVFTAAMFRAAFGVTTRSTMQGRPRAVFGLSPQVQEAALYTIIKSAATSASPAEFVVMSGRQRLRAGATMGDALDFFCAKMALVAAGPS